MKLFLARISLILVLWLFWVPFAGAFSLFGNPPVTIVQSGTISTTATGTISWESSGALSTSTSTPSKSLKLTTPLQRSVATGALQVSPVLTTKAASKSTLAATGDIATSLDATGSASELNIFIIDLYKPKIDKLLEDFQSATRKATKGDARSEIITYVRLSDTVEKRRAGLEEQELTPNRKAILRWVLEYLRDSIDRIIESKRDEITNSFDS